MAVTAYKQTKDSDIFNICFYFGILLKAVNFLFQHRSPRPLQYSFPKHKSTNMRQSKISSDKNPGTHSLYN